MKKKFFSMFMAMTLAATAITGCGGGSGSNGGSAAKEEGGSAAEASADESSTFMIGGIGPLTGEAAIYGNAAKNGAQIAVDEINANGGVNGYKLELNFQDDEHDAEKSVNAYNTLKDWGMDMLFGTVTSTPCIAVSSETANDNMFQITPSGSAPDCVTNDNAFRVCFSDPDQGTKSAQYIGKNKLAKKVAIIYDSSDVYSSGIKDNFVKEAKNQDFEIVSDEAFTGDSKTDFSTQIQKAQDGDADLVFLPIYYTQAKDILIKADSMGYKPKFFGCDGLDGILTVEDFDLKLAEGVMLLTPFAADADDDLTKKFVSTYKTNFENEVPNQFAADSYDAIYAIKAAIEDSKVTPDMDVSEICDGMKASMTKIKLAPALTGDEITWNESGEPNKEPKAVIINKEQYKSMD